MVHRADKEDYWTKFLIKIEKIFIRSIENSFLCEHYAIITCIIYATPSNNFASVQILVLKVLILSHQINLTSLKIQHEKEYDAYLTSVSV